MAMSESLILCKLVTIMAISELDNDPLSVVTLYNMIEEGVK